MTALAFAPATSFAASATQDGYDDDDDVEVQQDTDTGTQDDTTPAETSDAQPTATSNSSLPFTGLEAGLIAAAGLGLAGTGIVLRRAARDEPR